MLARIVSEMSQSGLADSLSTMSIQGKIALSALGIKWYSDLQVERKIPLKDVTFTNLASAVLDNTSWPGAISEIFPSEADPTLEKYPRPAPKELKIPPINLTRISFVDNGLTIDTEILFDNFLPINTQIPNAVIPIYVNDVMLSKIRIRRLALTPPANTPSRLTPSIDLVNPPDVTADKLLNGVTQLLSPDAKVSVVGPIEWAKPIRYQGGKEEVVTTAVNEVSDEGAPWLSTITKGFRLDIRTRQLLGFLSRSGGLSVPDILKNLKVETESGSASLIPSRLKYRYNLDIPARGVPSFKFLYNIQAQAAFTSSVIDAVIRYTFLLSIVSFTYHF
ncbi:hypothetical protein BKA69DRAFT_1096599 [Paraphysoderma sedebokerense]|nr:hypothetical protein BKA69DRAFT_1096599 [Paraphysoderma sedebokerense]